MILILTFLLNTSPVLAAKGQVCQFELRRHYGSAYAVSKIIKNSSPICNKARALKKVRRKCEWYAANGHNRPYYSCHFIGCFEDHWLSCP